MFPGVHDVVSGIPMTELPPSINVEVEFDLVTETLRPVELVVFMYSMLDVETAVPGEKDGKASEFESTTKVSDPPDPATEAWG